MEELKRALAPFQGRLRREAALRSVAIAGLTVLPLALAGAGVCRALRRPLSLLPWSVGVWALGALLLYALRERPTLRETARRVDALGLHNAVGTAVEYQRSEREICRMQRAQAVERVRATDPATLPVSVPGKRLAACACLLAALGVVCALPWPLSPDAEAFAQSDAAALLQARLDALRETILSAELRESDRAELLGELDSLQQRLGDGALDVTSLAELSRRMDELSGSVGQLTPVDTYAEALMEIDLLRPIGEAIAAEDEQKLDDALGALEGSLTASSGTEQINALMDVVYAIGSSMRRPVRDERQDVLAHAFAVLSGEMESAAAMVYNRQDNTEKIAGAIDGVRSRVLDFWAGKDLERKSAAQEEEETQRRLSHWADKPGENEIDYAAVETVFDPRQSGAPEGYVPGALDAQGNRQAIVAPEEAVAGEVPYGEVYARAYADFLSGREQLPQELQEAASAYFLSLQ